MSALRKEIWWKMHGLERFAFWTGWAPIHSAMASCGNIEQPYSLAIKGCGKVEQLLVQQLKVVERLSNL
jgi:hypothetical protein